ncbi:MAG: NAD-dependent epimerase/dehydratase family protein [Planctomycetota bacterium]|nr:NAD-dependent epimerase/dehydratase family protein [Planctomycetota bacterium]
MNKHTAAGTLRGEGEFAPQKAAVFGATGSTGRVITQSLLRRGIETRVVARSRDHLDRDFDGMDVERAAGNVSDADDAARLAEGCDVVFHCVGLPLDEYERHAEFGSALAGMSERTGARVVLISGYWSFAPIEHCPIDESHPRRALTPMTKARVEQEDRVRAAGGAVVVLPDFYGPGATKSFLNDVIRKSIAGEKAMWPGRIDAKRDFIFVPDIGPIVVDLALREGAYGESWVVAGSGAAMPRELFGMIEAAAGAEVRPAPVTKLKLAFGALVKPEARAFKPIFPIYNGAAWFDDSKLRGLLGDVKKTGYEEGLRRTVAWLKGEYPVGPA